MNSPRYRLQVNWSGNTIQDGTLHVCLYNLGSEALEDFRLFYTSLSRIGDPSRCTNAILVRRNANLHEFAPPDRTVVPPGGSWTFSAMGLERIARHITDGASSAYLKHADGTVEPVSIGPFLPLDRKIFVERANPLPFRKDVKLSLVPWPNGVRVESFADPPNFLRPEPEADLESRQAFFHVAALDERLFSGLPPVFCHTQVDGARELHFRPDPTLGVEAFRLEFAKKRIILHSAGGKGKVYGLIALAQLMRGVRENPARFRFPERGEIADSPRFPWRGCHLDVSRQVYSQQQVGRLIDILAWNRLNVLHWHLTDDEGWRLQIKAYPELTDIGARRGPGEKMEAQLGGGATTIAGFFTREQVEELVVRASDVNVDIMPEIDIPGHCMAALLALPELSDGQEAPDSYSSVQGYTNNALNPAVSRTYEFLQDVFEEVVQMFPFPYIHVGGDEVGEGAWLSSPMAKKLMADHGLKGSSELQAYFLRRVKTIVSGLGRKLAGWDEVSHGGGVERADTLLMAWQSAQVGARLAREGYDVVMAPGEAYYLDMVQSENWMEPGLNWASGAVPLQKTYEFEAAGDFPPELSEKLKGIEGCIWSENLVTRERFNHMVFPRLSAIAESAWTEQQNKDYSRFATLCHLMPVL